MKIFLYYIGKARDTHANAMAEEYIKRSTRYATCEMREIHPGRFDPWAKHPTAKKILLDPLGKKLDSAGFIAQVEKWHDMIFVIGGSDGFCRWSGGLERICCWRFPADDDAPHELARVVLAEQIYRALTTLRGHPYPR